jgi:hypothetical protein
VKNGKTQRIELGYSGALLAEDAVAGTLRRVEETTPVGELPQRWEIVVERFTAGEVAG